MKPSLEASCLIPGTRGVDMLPATVAMTLLWYAAPVTYCS